MPLKSCFALAFLADSNAARHVCALTSAGLAKAKTMQGFPSRLIALSEKCPFDMQQRDYWSIQDFVQVREIGNGAASSVYYSFCRKSCTPVALKMYKKSKLSVLNRRQVEREIAIHSSLNHPHIVDFYAAFEDDEKIYLVQEYASGGDLFDEVKRRGGRLPEDEVVSNVLYPYMCALMYIHGRGIIHRDIKPENTVFTKEGVMKITDFGLAINGQQERPVTRLGTLDYMAPEVLRCPDKHHPNENKDRADLEYGMSVDAWAIGVLAYELIVGRPPFGMSCRESTMRAIHTLQPVFPDVVSSEARDFINSALCKTSTERYCISQLMQHPWVLRHTRSQLEFVSPFAAAASTSFAHAVVAPEPTIKLPIYSSLESHVELRLQNSTPSGQVKFAGVKRAPMHRCNSAAVPGGHTVTQPDFAKTHVAAYWHTDGERFGDDLRMHHLSQTNSNHVAAQLVAPRNLSRAPKRVSSLDDTEEASQSSLQQSTLQSVEELKQLWLAGREGLRGLYNKVVSRSFNLKRRPDESKRFLAPEDSTVVGRGSENSVQEMLRSKASPPSPSNRHSKAKRVNPLHLEVPMLEIFPGFHYETSHPSSPESHYSTGTQLVTRQESGISVTSLSGVPSLNSSPHGAQSAAYLENGGWQLVGSHSSDRPYPLAVLSPHRQGIPASLQLKSRSFTVNHSALHTAASHSYSLRSSLAAPTTDAAAASGMKYLPLGLNATIPLSPSPLGLSSNKDSQSSSHSSSEGSDASYEPLCQPPSPLGITLF